MRRTIVRTAVPLVAAALAGLFAAGPSVADVSASAEGLLVRNPAGSEVLPAGAWAEVRAVSTGSGKTIVTLQVRGLAPDEEYGAHAHYKPCGLPTQPLASGAHYQKVVDTAVLAAATASGRDYETIASVDSAFANPDNEVWLDFTTNSQGIGRAQTVVDWQFRPATSGRSVVIHASHTGPTGGAGPRLGCISVRF